MKKYINCVVLGAGNLGCTVIKEIARFLSCFQGKGTKFDLTICDKQSVHQSDLGGLYLAQDIGWSKAAIVKQLIVSNLNRHHENDNFKFENISNRDRAFFLDIEKKDNLYLD